MKIKAIICLISVVLLSITGSFAPSKKLAVCKKSIELKCCASKKSSDTNKKSCCKENICCTAQVNTVAAILITSDYTIFQQEFVNSSKNHFFSSPHKPLGYVYDFFQPPEA